MSVTVQRGPSLAWSDFHANRPWRVLLPPVYRYLPKEYVDRFFDTGELRLSSVALFKQHKDEARADSDEGGALIAGLGGGKHLLASVSTGQQSYILCGSHILSATIMNSFPGCDAAIEIASVPDFGQEIARQLAGFMSGISGYCIYANNRILVRHLDHVPFPLPPGEGEDVPVEMIAGALNAIGQGEELFLKHSKFSSQAEYRLIWNIDKPSQDHIFVVAPQARAFCRRVSPEEIS
jgi:hypothetical protein